VTIHIKTAEEIQKMRLAGKLAADVLQMIAEFVKPGISTNKLNDICHDYIVNTQQAIPAPLNYRGFPKSICTSPNHVICHGIPGDKRLKKGDILNIDVTIVKDGFHGDTSKMFMIGKPAIRAQRLVQAARQAMLTGIKMIKPGVRLGAMGHAISAYAKKFKFSVVHEYCGHGIGRNFHEEPQVLHYGTPDAGVILEPGMTFTIEPMINSGKRHVKLLKDNWTVVTKDKSLSAQWEHTVLVTDTGYEVLTARTEERDLY